MGGRDMKETRPAVKTGEKIEFMLALGPKRPLSLLPIFIVIPLLFALGCARRPEAASEHNKIPAGIHILTWKSYDGFSERAQYVFDDKPCGTGTNGIRALEQIDLQKGDRVRIVEPEVLGPSSPAFLIVGGPPYSKSDLIEFWQSKGIQLEVQKSWWDGDVKRTKIEKLSLSAKRESPSEKIAAPTHEMERVGESLVEVHRLTWQNYDGETGSPNDAIYVFDGKVIGKGDEGIAALKKIPLPRGCIIRIKIPWVDYPSGPVLYPPFSHSDLTKKWDNEGIATIYIPTNPIAPSRPPLTTPNTGETGNKSAAEEGSKP
jgi:hypothetical protein